MKLIKRIVKNLYDFANDVSRHNSAAYAGSVSFFFFLSMIPTLMFLFTLIPYLSITKDDLILYVENIVPANILNTVVSGINDVYAASSSALPIIGIAAIWTASVGILGLIRGLNGILEIEDDRNYFVLRGIATFYTLLLLVALLIVMSVSVLGKSLIKHIVSYYPNMYDFLHAFYYFKWIIVWVILFVVFTLAYAFLPAKRQRMIYQTPGAAFSSLGWIVVTWGFSVYIDYFHGFSAYGSLMGLMIILFWFYVCFSLVIIGAYLNKYYKAQFAIGYQRAREKRAERKKDKE